MSANGKKQASGSISHCDRHKRFRNLLFLLILYWSVSEGEHYFSCIMSWELIGSRLSMDVHSPVLIFYSFGEVKSRQQWTRYDIISENNYNMTEHCVCQFTFLEYIQTLLKSVSIVGVYNMLGQYCQKYSNTCSANVKNYILFRIFSMDVHYTRSTTIK